MTLGAAEPILHVGGLCLWSLATREALDPSAAAQVTRQIAMPTREREGTRKGVLNIAASHIKRRVNRHYAVHQTFAVENLTNKTMKRREERREEERREERERERV